MVDGEVQCLYLAGRQLGVLSLEQARKYLSEKQVYGRVRRKVWARVLPGVFRVAGSHVSWRQWLKALCLWAGRGFALSHATAAALHGLKGFEEGRLVLSVTRHLAPKGGVIVHRISTLSPKELSSIEGFTVTSPTRTILDLAAELEVPALREVLTDALRRKKTTLEGLEDRLSRAKTHAGAARLRALVNELQGGTLTESELEDRVYALLEGSGFPRPVKQKAVYVGHRLRRLDFFFLEFNVVIEADGYAYHSSPEAFERDRKRNNALLARGYRVLHWTWSALHGRPEELLLQLATLLSRAA